jgi:uracil-DNA glycosylase family 4
MNPAHRDPELAADSASDAPAAPAPWSLEDAAAESLALVDALAAHFQRARRLGVRAVAAPPTQSPPPAKARASDAPTDPAAPAARPPAPKTPPAQVGASADSHTLIPRPRVSPAPAAPSSPAPGGLDPAAELAARVAANRSAAAACADLDSLRRAVAACTACELCKTRKQTVFSDGDGSAGVLFIGEAPGANEDEQGVPFVGAAGALLTDILHKGMRVERSKVAIANVLKCRPPGNRDPTDQEKALCTPWLDRQVELLQPRVVVALGRHAANHVLGYAGAARRSLGSLRGQVYERGGRKVVVTFHPSNLLREPDNKKECWKDIQLAMRELGLALPTKPTKSG